MLYTEFLNGTFEPDNKWTYKEYKRIEAIYNNNNDMTKEEAYRLFREPDPFTRELLEEIAELKSLNIQKEINLSKLEKDKKTLTEKIESQERTIKSLLLTRDEIIKEVEVCKSHISNIFWG